MSKRKKTAKKESRVVRINRVYALILAVSGVLFIAIPARIAEVLPYYLFALMLLHTALMLYCSSHTKKRAEKIWYGLDAAISFALCVLFIVFRERSADLAAIFMAIRTAAAVVEYAAAIGRNRRAPRAIVGCVFLIVINLVLLAKLVTEIGESVETQIVVYGLLLFDFTEPESWKRPEAKNV